MMNTFTSPHTSKVYTFTHKPESRVGGFDAISGNPITHNYYTIDVFDPNGNKVNFGFVDDCSNSDDVRAVVKSVVEWHENPNGYDYSVYSSRFD
jgi:hypothetical protein